MSRKLNYTDTAQLLADDPKAEVFGNGDFFEVISKVSSPTYNWAQTVRVKEIPDLGVIVQTITESNGEISEALITVLGAELATDEDGNKTIVKTEAAAEE